MIICIALIFRIDIIFILISRNLAFDLMHFIVIPSLFLALWNMLLRRSD